MYSFYIGRKVTSFSLNQYFYIITLILIYMKVKELLKSNLCKATAVLGLSVLSFNSAQAQTNVTVDTNAEWITGVVAFHANMEYWFYANDFPLEALKTIVNTTDNTVALYPNYSTYTAGDPNWSNGAMGNTILYTLSYVEADNLVGQNFTFSGKVTSHTLVDDYEAYAFIKILTADYQQIAEIPFELTEEGNFTLAYDATNLAAGSHIQYGFQVRGLNANPVNETAYGNVVVTDDEPGEVEQPGATDVTLTATTANVIGYANRFELDGTTWAGGEPWGVESLKTVMNTDGSVDLHPNFNAWGTGANDGFWIINGQPAKIFEGNTYVDDATLLNQTVTFTGHCVSNTLTDDYDAIAFIKVLSADYQLVNYTHVPLIGGEDFSITVGPGDYTNGAHFQYGYSVTGVIANPANEAALGFAKVGAASASVTDFAKGTAVLYPNPVNNTLNINSGDTIDAVQIYNLMGQLVYNAKPAQNNATVNVSGLTSGVYIVTTTIAGKQTSERIVKQ